MVAGVGSEAAGNVSDTILAGYPLLTTHYSLTTFTLPLQPVSAPPSPPSRLTTTPFPAYRHVPGLTPHPVTHPDGRSYRAVEAPIEPVCLELPDNWARCRNYLFGIDLFNYAYHWEAHEEWEAVWHAVGHDSPPGQFLQALIQVSAALLKHHMGVARGAASLRDKAFRRLDSIEKAWVGSGVYMGIEVESWRRLVDRWLARDAQRFPFLIPDLD